MAALSIRRCHGQTVIVKKSVNSIIIDTMKTLTSERVAQFQKFIYDFYKKNKRDFSWRENITPYKIIVSEVMLQQTQTTRVLPKFENWIQQFPSFESLAQASNHEVLRAWQGLGYNRRGLALSTIAQLVIKDHDGQLPTDPLVLKTFPAIGPNTAGSVCAFAFNLPIVFIETNIRTVFTHTFFQNQTDIHDKQLLPLIEQTLDQKNAREWYYALMDYGVHLKKGLPKINAASKHYTRQSKFIGSKRQIRGEIIKILTQSEQIERHSLIDLLNFNLPQNNHNKNEIIQNLIDEQTIKSTHNILYL